MNVTSGVSLVQRLSAGLQYEWPGDAIPGFLPLFILMDASVFPKEEIPSYQSMIEMLISDVEPIQSARFASKELFTSLDFFGCLSLIGRDDDSSFRRNHVPSFAVLQSKNGDSNAVFLSRERRRES